MIFSKIQVQFRIRIRIHYLELRIRILQKHWAGLCPTACLRFLPRGQGSVKSPQGGALGTVFAGLEFAWLLNLRVLYPRVQCCGSEIRCFFTPGIQFRDEISF
jgi:hypothetical protein